MNGSGKRPPLPAPKIGQHSREILTEIGFDTATIESLLAAGVVEETRKP